MTTMVIRFEVSTLTKALGQRDQQSITLDEVKVTIPTICFLMMCPEVVCSSMDFCEDLKTARGLKNTTEKFTAPPEVQGQLHC